MKPIKFPAADATRTTHILRTGRNLPRPFVDKARTAAEQMTPSLERDALEAALSGASIAPAPKTASKKPKDDPTDATSGNTGNWPEVTTHQLPLSVSGSVQGHFINLDTWNAFSAEEQAALEEEFRSLEDQLWELAVSANGQPCIVDEVVDVVALGVGVHQASDVGFGLGEQTGGEHVPQGFGRG